jgi:outer membrane immunogenic protein
MRRLLAASASLVTLAALMGVATAADLPRRPPPPAVKAPVYNPIFSWTGFYVGINGGGGWGRSRWDSIANHFNVSGGMIGGTVGYNMQSGQIVYGLEGDIDWSGIKGSTTQQCGQGCETSNTWLSTVRGRLGYSFDRLLPYVTGGLAFGNVKASVPGFAGASNTDVGWTVGGGLEYALAQNWSLKAEYLHADLGKFNCGLSCGGPATDNVSLRANIVRGGVNYRF